MNLETVIGLRQDLSASQLRAAAAREASTKLIMRLHALAELLEGDNKTTVARRLGVKLQTVRRWVVRYNSGGIDALVDRRRHARRPAPSASASPAPLATAATALRGQAVSGG